MQLTIHLTENNARSQAELDAFREQFIDSTWKVLTELLKGRVLTVRGAIIENLSGHLPRRIKDITSNGIRVNVAMAVPEWGGKKVAFYWMDAEEIIRLNKIVKQLID